jgi:AcrR family transcriptional regulator
VTNSRRTQAERRAGTQAALLDATLDCVVEHGYARVTSAQIADRAGVTRGALAHHFTTKAELVVASLSYLAERLVARFHDSPPQGADEPETLLAVLDHLWALHTEPVFTAAIELSVASRTDTELREHMAEFDRALFREFMEITAKMTPRLTGTPAFRDFLITALATMRGMALHRFVAGEEAVTPLWEITRSQLRELVGNL